MRNRYIRIQISIEIIEEKAFDNVLGVNGICPDKSLYFVCLGTALCADKVINTKQILDKLLQQNYNLF